MIKKEKSLFFHSFALALFLGIQCFISGAYAEPAVNDIQYLGVHKIESQTSNDNRWAVSNPDSFNQDGIDEILNAIGTKGRTTRRLAVSHHFSYLDRNIQNIVDSLENMFKLAVKNDIPVIVHLDGVNWWSTRPDLWNWWEPSEPGYNENNIHNVERYDWDINTAVKIGWRNWRWPVNPLRVPPHPNLASEIFRAEQKKALDKILPVIVEWYNALPSDQKYLLGGVVLGCELSPYLQAYYLDGGHTYGDFYNSIKPPADDPFPIWGTGTPQNPGNVWALGYAAAQKLGLQKEKGIITQDTVDAICRDFLKFLIGIALEHGIEAKKIIAHTMPGFSTARGGGHSGMASIVSDIPDIIPGWTTNTDVYKTHLGNVINETANLGRSWAVIEIAYSHVDAGLFKEMFDYRNNRYINVLNWESFKDDPTRTGALRAVLIDGGSVSIGAQNGTLAAGTAGFAKFPATTTEIIDGTAIALNNINSAAGVTLDTAVTTGDTTTLIIWTTAETPEGAHPLTLTIDGLTSNIFNLVVANKVSLDDVKYYPNPIQPSKGSNYSSMQFSNIPAGTGIKIYTLLGQTVRELKADASGMAVWDGKNNAGEKAASGVYIVYMEDGNGNKKRIKIAVEK